jgi:hypothetical protein
LGLPLRPGTNLPLLGFVTWFLPVQISSAVGREDRPGAGR